MVLSATDLKRRALWASAWNLAVFGVITVLIMGISFFAFVLEKIGSRYPQVLIENFPNYGLFSAMSFGLLGAFFSRLISLQFTSEMTVENAENRYGPTSLLIRAAVGMCGAAVIYFLLGTELLGNTLKPSFTEKLSFIPTTITPMLSPTAVNVLMPWLTGAF